MLDKSQIIRLDSSSSIHSKLNQSWTEKRLSQKRISQISSRFDYYKQTINEYSMQKQSISKTKFSSKQALIGPNQFYYVNSERDRFHYFDLITLELLQNIVEKVSVEMKKNQKPTNQKEKQKSYFNCNQKQIKTMVFSANYGNNKGQSMLLGVNESAKSEIGCSENEEKEQYCIYLISKSKEQKPAWIYCIQKYTIKSVQQKDQKMVLINFQSILGVPKTNSSSFSIINYIFDRNQQSIYEEFLLNTKNRINFIQQNLVKELKLKFKQCQKQEKIAHLSFKRQDRIPPEHIALYHKLKSQIYKYNIQCNSHSHSPKLSHYSLDNLICRFFKYRQYNSNKTLQSIQDYLQWYKSMREKYNQSSFQDYQKYKIYEMIGRDNEGRVILLLRPHNIYMELVGDEDRYVDYTLYMLELFIQDNTEGYIDEFILLADYSLFGRENFKYSVAKKVSDKANQLFPDRQHRLVVFGLGTFSYFIYKMVKPILPSFLTEKIIVFGSDKQQLLNYLKQLMDTEQLTEEITQQNKQFIYKKQ